MVHHELFQTPLMLFIYRPFLSFCIYLSHSSSIQASSDVFSVISLPITSLLQLPSRGILPLSLCIHLFPWFLKLLHGVHFYLQYLKIRTKENMHNLSFFHSAGRCFAKHQGRNTFDGLPSCDTYQLQQ